MREIMSIRIADVAAEARQAYGDNADEIVGRKLPEHEFRFEVELSDGSRATMHYGATADDIQEYLGQIR